jgi:small subunit ribosomal protein S5
MVKQGLITSIDQIFAMNQPIKEPEIVDALVPGLTHEVIDVSLVQKQTDTA